ncbi:hypothetical protein [Pseudomonas indica]|uniref:hypothetical protein n=1 Tax=Pseudomonas indica TaxID=137658 RepID=UPI001C3EEAA6|nr:hypothetical protein [Pseudomonas indica]
MDALAFGYACFAGPALPSRHQEILSLGGYVAPVHGPLNEDVPLMDFATGEVLDRPYPRRSQARSALDFYDDYSIVPRVSPNGDLIHDLLAGASNVGNIPLNLGGALIGSFAEVMHSTGADKLLDPLMALPGFGVGAGATRGMLSGITALAAARAEARFAGVLVPNNTHLGARGAYSGREFDPDLAGGPLRDLYNDKIKFTDRGIDVVEKHTARFGPDEANQYMIDRLRKIASGEIEPTQVDRNFYSHELREYVRYRRLGWETGQPVDLMQQRNLWNNTHTATLEEYRIPGPNTDPYLYHPEAIKLMEGF